MQQVPDKLISAYMEGGLSAEQAKALSQWVQASHDNALYLASLATLEQGLIKQAKMQSNSDILAELEQDENDAPVFASVLDVAPQPIHLDANALTKEKYLSALSYVIRHTFTPKRVAVLATAAALLLCVVVTIVVLIGPGQGEQVVQVPDAQVEPNEPGPVVPFINPVVATLTAERDALWDRRPEQDLYAGQRFELTHGSVEITTKRGAVAIVEAPATIEFTDSDNAIQLHSGKLVGICETESSKGFLVRTPHMDITDLGTEFGVEVAGEHVTATVFSGVIEVAPIGSDPQRLVRNQTASLSIDRDEVVFVVEERLADGFTQRIPRDLLTTSANLLGVSGYEVNVIEEGFWAGAKPYTDRDFVVTGVVPEGLPTALLGGDLVQMPGDARSLIDPAGENLRLELDLARPSDVYILLSERQKPTDWLARDYEQTPMRVGIRFNEQRTDTYHVWRRQASATGRTVVAADVPDSMYGVVVVPRAQAGGTQP